MRAMKIHTLPTAAAARGATPFTLVHLAKRNVRALNVVAADLPVASDAPSVASTKVAVRKYLLSIGWMEAWVDGVTTEIAKRNLTTNVDSCEAVINYLMSLGISLHGVENMVSLCKPILGRSVDELATVVSWLERKGVSDRKLLVRFLMANPVVLIYNPSSSDDVLEKGKSRISLALGERGGVTSVGIILYREDAAFGTAPVSPVKP